jgi:hypothetical protein
VEKMSKLLESVNKRDFDRRISEVVEMLGEKQLYGTISLIKDLKYYLDLATKEKAHTCNCQHNSNSRDNEPCCGCDNRTAKINKARVNSLEIIAHMLNNKPYYELKYRQVGKKDYSIGYSSYDLKTVLGYIDTYFEIAESDKHTNADRIRNMSDEELAEFNLCPHMVNWKKGNYDTCVHPNDKDACKKCMLDWLQSEAE